MPVSPLSPALMVPLSMHSQPGVYAVLLGSGVSTGAGIRTGWGVVEDLTRRAAAADPTRTEQSQALAERDPAAWWAAHSDEDLGYANLLEALASTPAARQGLLAEFFEPTDDERDQGIKVASAAHHAVAQLTKRGTVRVIVTTNFDRLTEQALEATGVSPQVIARPEAVTGMAPLAHSDATVIKLHGDYQDLGSLNTPEELSAYPTAWTTLLAQIFDEYGLLISGWSADYDTALVNSLNAAPSRRYPLYWDSRSSKGHNAQQLLANRAGHIVPAAGADELFTELTGALEALDRLAQPPLTTAMAIARVKRYLPNPVRRIDLHDLLIDAATRVADYIADQPLITDTLDGQYIEKTWDGYLQAVTPLTHMLITGVWHDTNGTHDRLWTDVIQRLVDAGTAPVHEATTGLLDARLWPALIATTTLGTAAVIRDREPLTIRANTHIRGRVNLGTNTVLLAAELLHPARLLRDPWVNAMPRWGSGEWVHPASHLLKTDLRPFFEDLIPNNADYVDAVHGYEYRLGLIQENEDPDGNSVYLGEYIGERGWARTADDEPIPLAERAFRAAAERSQDWPWPDYLEDPTLHTTLIIHRGILEKYRWRR